MEELVFVKLGGSLITDKREQATLRRGVLRRMAHELREALTARPTLRVLLGHGSGSFGHWEAKRYGTRQGVATAAQWAGFARVSAAAATLDRIVADAFLAADVAILSLPPSASLLADGGHIVTLTSEPIRHALDVGLVPLIFGDVAFDRQWGGTILSTEDLFFHLAEELRPARILLLGNAPGVLDDARCVIPRITPETYPQVKPHLYGARYTDVTGGMADKVEQMVALVQRIPDLQVRILTGLESGNLTQALLHPDAPLGTCVVAR